MSKSYELYARVIRLITDYEYECMWAKKNNPGADLHPAIRFIRDELNVVWC